LFVGASRRAQVESLLAEFDRAVVRREPLLITLVAAPGAGKTRIIQEFYRELAGRQPAPPYWPASLLAESPDGGLGLAELTASRKTVRLRASFAPSPGASIPWLWLAPAAGRLSDGSPAPAFDGLVSQFTPHVSAIMRRLEAADALDPAREDAIKLAVADLVTGAVPSGDRPEQLAGLMSWLLPPDRLDGAVPTILILDDAHELDETTVGFVKELLTAELPVLIIATTWPEEFTPADGRPLSPFCEYLELAEAGGSTRVGQESLGRLGEDDLVGYITDQFPATDQQVAASLAARADRNPYALRLLLNTLRVSDSVRGDAITLEPEEIANLDGRLETLLADHWAALPAGVRQVLVAAALLGQSFLDEVLEAGLRRVRPRAGIGDALASSWIRPLVGPDRILEFAERLRYDIAKAAAPDFLSDTARADICRGALRLLRQLLPDQPEGTGRIVLLALHVLLTQEGVEDDLAAAAASAAELAERARSEQRRRAAIEYYELAISWAEAATPVPMRQLVDYLVNFGAVNRINYGRAAGEAAAERAVQLADEFLDPRDELRIHARYQLSRARRRLEDPDVYASARDLFAAAQDLLGELDSPSPEAVRDVRGLQIEFIKDESRFGEAADLTRNLVAFCEDHFGPLHRHTLNALDDLGYCVHRSGGAEEAIAVRRMLLDRRVQRFNDAAHLQTAGTRTDLGVSLLATRDPRHLDEAEELIEESITRRSRAFGFDGRPTRLGRSARTRVWMARGLIAEAGNDPTAAARLFTTAADEARRLLELRKDERPGTYALALQRYGEALACLRQADAITVLDDALDVRESRIGQDHTFWAFQDCVKSLWWAYQRLGRAGEAAAVANRYRLDGDPEDWTPAFVPKRTTW
jgi:hypothetical protein